MDITEFLANAIVLTTIWYGIAKYFYLRHASIIAKKTALELLDDDEYVAKSQAAQERWMREMVGGEVDKVQSKVEDALGRIEIPSFEWGPEMDNHLTSWWKGITGSMARQAIKQNREEEQNLRDAIQYTQMNPDNPDAMALIQQRLLQKSPMLAMGLQMLQQSQQGNLQSQPRGPNGPGGGY